MSDPDQRAKSTNCRLVMVEWEDSRQPAANWSFLSDFEGGSAVRVASVGWLIQDDEKMKVVAPNMGGLLDGADLQVSGMIQIPTSCVLRVSELAEPAPLDA